MFCMCFVDFVAVNVIIVGLCIVLYARFCRFGRAVFSDEAFQVVMCVCWLVVCISCIMFGGILSIGGGGMGVFK